MTNAPLYTAKTWRILFFVGVVFLNIMVPFRGNALKSGGMRQFVWSGGVIAIGAFLLWCLWQLRLHRQVKHAARMAASQHQTEPDTEEIEAETHDNGTGKTPTAFVPSSRQAALQQSKKAQKKKKKKKKRKR